MVRRSILVALLTFLLGLPLYGGGMVVSVKGDVYLTRDKKSMKVKGGEELEIGDTIDASLGTVMILVGEDQMVLLKDGMLKLQKIERKVSIYLFGGGARWVVSSGEEKKFYTPTAIVTSRNANVVIKYLKNSNSTEVYMLEGKGSVKNIKEDVKEKIALSPLKITVVKEGSPPANMLLSLSIQDKKDLISRYSLVDTFRNRYTEKRDLVELGAHLYEIESNRSSVFVYPNNNPFPEAYSGDYFNKLFKTTGNGSIKVRWLLNEDR